MARLATQSQTAASGMDLTSDPVSMSLSRARRLVNFQVSRSGRVQSNVRLVDVLPGNGAVSSIDGIGWYYQAALRNNPFSTDIFFHDLLLWATASFLFAARSSADPLTTPVSNVQFVGGGITGYAAGFSAFFAGKRVRFFSLGDEILMVQDGGLIMLRSYFSPTLGQGFFRAGFEPPSVSNLTLSAVGTGLTGTWGYKLTYADERFRESSPTPVVNITLTNQATHAVSPNIGTFSPPTSYGGSNWRYAYLYRNTIGAPDVFYQIARHTIPSTNPASITFGAGDYYNTAAANDDSPDADIVNPQLIGPNPGENDPPLPASIGVVHKNRVFLNDINDANTLQVSNQGSATQFAALSVLPTDGGRFEIGTDQGNSITALVEFGSILAIFKRRGSYFLYGDSLSDFVVRPVHQRGCIAPDSAYRCDNVVCFLSDDGVYAAAYEGGDVVTKISKEIEADLLTQSIDDRETSVGWFVDNRYHISVGPITYVYDFDAQGWTCYQFGSGALSYGNGIPDTTVAATVGFAPMGNSALYGSVVPGETGCTDPCDIRVTPASIGAPKEGGVYILTIEALNSARFGYMVSDGWIHVSDATTSGSGTALVTIDPNTACMDRDGKIVACGVTIDINQAGVPPPCDGACDVSVTPLSFPALPATPSIQVINVTLNTPIIPSASTDVDWLHVSSYFPIDATHGSFTVNVDSLPLCTNRTGNVMICDVIVPFTQPFDVTIVSSPSTYSGSYHRVSVNISGDNFANGTFTFVTRGKYNPSRVPSGAVVIYNGGFGPPYTISPVVMFDTNTGGNLYFQPTVATGPFPDPVGETLRTTITSCDGSQGYFDWLPQCYSPMIFLGDGATAITACSPTNFGPHTSNIPIPRFDPEYPDFGTMQWSLPFNSTGITAIDHWTITTPAGHTATYAGSDPGPYYLSLDQQPEVQGIMLRPSGSIVSFGVVINIFGIESSNFGCVINPIGSTSITANC